MKNKRAIIISLIFNAIIVAITIFSSVVLFAEIQFMSETPLIKSTRLGMFKFFTTDSNLLLGAASLVFLIYECRLLLGKTKEIPRAVYILKFTATCAVALTFVVVFGYLEFIVKGGALALIKNSSLFFHLISPILGVVTFVCFERNNKIKFKHTFLGALPAIVYAIFYTANALSHAKEGKVALEFDFYSLVQGGIWQAAIVVPLLLGIAYGISVVLWASSKSKK